MAPSCGFVLFALLLLITTTSQGLDIRECNRPLGMQSGRIEDGQLSASSSFDQLSTGPANARIRTETGSGAWCPSNQINGSSHEWIQVEFEADSLITGIETQGRWDRGRGLEYLESFMLEYWRESLGRWARYKDGKGNEIVQGNTDTQTAVLHLLNGAILAKLVRLIPVSESTRTVCLRFELFGCIYKESLLSYSMPDGMMLDNLDLRDITYDGSSNGTQLTGGLGTLFDGVTARDNFEEDSQGWVGWHRSRLQGDFVPIEFEFDKRQNISAILLHTSNFGKGGAKVFEHAKLYFAPVHGGVYSARKVEFDYAGDTLFQASRWIRIPIPNRIVAKMRVELYLAKDAEWLLVSELKFESGNVPFQFTDLDRWDDGSFSESVLTPLFDVGDSTNNEVQSSKCILIGMLIAIALTSLSLSAVFYCLLHKRRTDGGKQDSFQRPSKSLLQLILHSSKEHQQQSQSKYLAAMNYKISINHMPIPPPLYPNYDSSESVYAEPDATEEDLSEPLLLRNANATTHRCSNINGSIASARYHSTPSGSVFNGGMACSTSSTVQDYKPSSQPTPTIPLLEFQPSALHFVKKMGRGKFGEVHLCRLDEKLVAVNHLQSMSSTSTTEVTKELTLLGSLKHQNIVNIIGTCYTNSTLCLIVEFMPNGDLSQFLRSNTTRLNTEHFSSDVLTCRDLISFSTHIAAAMAYLESKNFLHGDLAARNFLMDADGSVKLTIGDFGMNKNLLYNSDYCTVAENPLPIRWMSWEALLMSEFSTKTDVWSFGVTVWEVFILCSSQPYPKLTDDEVIENLQVMRRTKHLRHMLSLPTRCPKYVYDQVLLPCWKFDHTERPNFADLHRLLQSYSLKQTSANNNSCSL